MKVGDAHAFKELVEGYGQHIYNTCLGFLQDQVLAEDMTQEVFITIFRTIEQFNERSALSTWIYRIAVNKCIDYQRAQNRHKRLGNIISLHQTQDTEFDPSNFMHPGVLLEHKEEAQILFQALQKLPEQQKIAFTLKYVEQLSQKEIAEILEITSKAVESLLQRAKMNLRKILTGNQ